MKGSNCQSGGLIGGQSWLRMVETASCKSPSIMVLLFKNSDESANAQLHKLGWLGREQVQISQPLSF
jgi:hypothetical protein